MKGLSLDSGLQYSVQSGSLPRFNASLRYWPSDTKVVNFSYRYSKATNLNQFDTSWRWQVNNRWTALGRLNYSFSKTGTVTIGGASERPGLIEAILGAEYDQDCWAFRTVVQRFVTADRKPTTQVFLQLELKGLGTMDKKISTLLEKTIDGFKERDKNLR
jgi:LPS-assembly protein